MRAELGPGHNENYFLDFHRLSIVIWPHAMSSSIETVYAKWRILAYITIILNMDMAMPKRYVTLSVGFHFKQLSVATAELYFSHVNM